MFNLATRLTSLFNWRKFFEQLFCTDDQILDIDNAVKGRELYNFM